MIRPHEIDGILDQIARGNRDAFRQIVQAFGLPLRGYLASQIHHMADVDDLAQEVFIAAYNGLDTFRRGDDFGAWLRGIARNKLHVHFRSTARRSSALERFREEVARAIQADLEHAAAVDDRAMVDHLLHCIASLPDKLRRVVRAGLDGDRPAAVAKELMTTVGAVYNLHYRANQLLRECLQKEAG